MYTHTQKGENHLCPKREIGRKKERERRGKQKRKKKEREGRIEGRRKRKKTTWGKWKNQISDDILLFTLSSILCFSLWASKV